MFLNNENSSNNKKKERMNQSKCNKNKVWKQCKILQILYEGCGLQQHKCTKKILVWKIYRMTIFYDIRIPSPNLYLMLQYNRVRPKIKRKRLCN